MKTAQDIMSRTVFTVPADLSLEQLAREFGERGVDGFPVVDAGGALLGVVTESDLIHQNQRLHIPTTVAIFDAVLVLGSTRRLEEEMKRVAATRVEQIMEREPHTVHVEALLEDVAALMAEHDVYTLPVLDDDQRVVGVIGKIDVIRALAGG